MRRYRAELAIWWKKSEYKDSLDVIDSWTQYICKNKYPHANKWISNFLHQSWFLRFSIITVLSLRSGQPLRSLQDDNFFFIILSHFILFSVFHPENDEQNNRNHECDDIQENIPFFYFYIHPYVCNAVFVLPLQKLYISKCINKWK